MGERRVSCRTSTPGRTGVTRIPAWKFTAVRRAILEELTEGAALFSKLPDRVGARLVETEISQLGSLGWHVTTVKLELKTRGEIKRQAGVSPQLLVLAEHT